MSKINNLTIPFQHPFMLTVCSPSQSGQTFWILKLFKNIEVMIDPASNKIVYLYTSCQPLYDQMKKIIDDKENISIEFIDCNQGIPSAVDLQTNIGDNTLVVLDDLMAVATSSKEYTTNLNNFACCDAHHSNMSIVVI